MVTPAPEYKFRVKNEAHSIEIQQVLFKAGFGWGPVFSSTYNTMIHTHEPFLFAEVRDATITYVDNQMYFNSHDAKESFLLHPNQRKFLSRLITIDSKVKFALENGFYLNEDREHLNKLLKKYKAIEPSKV